MRYIGLHQYPGGIFVLVVADARGNLYWREIIEADSEAYAFANSILYKTYLCLDDPPNFPTGFAVEHGENLFYRIHPCLVTDVQLAAAFGRLTCKLHNRLISKELWRPSGCGRPHHYYRKHPKFNAFLQALKFIPKHFNWDVRKKNTWSSQSEPSLMRARVDAAYSVMALVKQTVPPSCAMIQEAASFPETSCCIASNKSWDLCVRGRTGTSKLVF